MKVSIFDLRDGKFLINCPFFTIQGMWLNLEPCSSVFDEVLSALVGNKIVTFHNGANSVLINNMATNTDFVINDLEELNNVKSLAEYISKAYDLLRVTNLEELSDNFVVINL